MVDAEDGFNFVDKRRTVAGDTVVDAVDAVDTTPRVPTDTEEPEPEPAVDHQASAAEPDDDEDPAEIWTLLQYCVHMLAAQSWQKLGLIADPRTAKVHRDLVQARVAIDAVGDLCSRLETAPDGILDAAARRELRNMVSDLRMNFVTQRNMAASEAPAAKS
ncbi:MAG: DUF1844 domain-containing protein [Capsulimonadaceae bacterium]